MWRPRCAAAPGRGYRRVWRLPGPASPKSRWLTSGSNSAAREQAIRATSCPTGSLTTSIEAVPLLPREAGALLLSLLFGELRRFLVCQSQDVIKLRGRKPALDLGSSSGHDLGQELYLAEQRHVRHWWFVVVPDHTSTVWLGVASAL